MRLWVLVMVSMVTACAQERDRRSTTTNGARDAGLVRDAGPGVVRDGGPQSSRDVGFDPDRDAGFRDAGFRDGGVGRDGGGAIDAGFPDSGVPSTPFCRQTCSTAAQCASTTPAFDADNYTCNAGICEYTGCNSNQECADTYQQPYRCLALPGDATPTCRPPCSTPSDCASPSPLYGADNYRCTSGVCDWIGCRSTAECVETFNDAAYTCASQPGLAFDNCIRTCSTATECVTTGAPPAFDLDNYACGAAGTCEYVGCNNAAECQASFPMGAWACR